MRYPRYLKVWKDSIELTDVFMLEHELDAFWDLHGQHMHEDYYKIDLIPHEEINARMRVITEKNEKADLEKKIARLRSELSELEQKLAVN